MNEEYRILNIEGTGCMVLIDGKKIAQEILDTVQERVKTLSFVPVFCDVVVGDDPVILSYVKAKGRAAESVGIKFIELRLSGEITEAELVERVREIQKTEHLSGLIVQLPLPSHISSSVVLNTIDPRLDVDCLGAENVDAFYKGEDALVPPTAAAIMQVLSSTPVILTESSVVVVGKGDLVGKPVAHMLQNKCKELTAVDRSTPDITPHVLSADVIISAAGSPGLISADSVKQGAVVIDAGTSESQGGILGDVDKDSVSEKASYLAAVPGGVGPVTISMLLSNVVSVAEKMK